MAALATTARTEYSCQRLLSTPDFEESGKVVIDLVIEKSIMIDYERKYFSSVKVFR